MNFPQGKRFAFTILDDTDDATLENVKPVYDALKAHGIRTTKTVWPVDCPEGSRIFFAADTLQRKAYLEFVRRLSADGFEVAFHGATMESSRRDRTVRALEFLKSAGISEERVRRLSDLVLQSRAQSGQSLLGVQTVSDILAAPRRGAPAQGGTFVLPGGGEGY
jgi:hypothetical protein